MKSDKKTGEHPLINYLKKHQEKTIAGNKEYYEILYYRDGQFYNTGGSTYPLEEEFNNEISEEAVTDKLISYYLDKCDTFALKKPTTTREWKIFLKENWHI